MIACRTLAFAFTLPAVAALAQSGAPSASQLAWLKAHAVEINTVDAGTGFADLQKLTAAVGGARIVSLGEATIGTREIFQMKHRLTEFLASELGFTIFSIEAWKVQLDGQRLERRPMSNSRCSAARAATLGRATPGAWAGGFPPRFPGPIPGW
jgi:predicted flavoprotein YhiN